jgi:hypothetical protein
MRASTFLCVTLALAPACKQSAPTEPSAEPGAAPAAAAAGTLTPATPEPAFVSANTGMRRAASDDKNVPDPATNKPKPNYLATLYRGEQVAALKQEGDWIQIRASDDTVGWVKQDAVLLASGVSMATVLEEAKTFTRPDFSALNPAVTMIPGTLLFVTKSKEPFSEVNFKGSSKAWVLSEKLSVEPNEIEASRLINKARWLDERKDATAKDFWELARSKFATTKLMQQLGGAPAADGAAPQPAAAPTQN